MIPRTGLLWEGDGGWYARGAWGDHFAGPRHGRTKTTARLRALWAVVRYRLTGAI